MVEHFGLAVEDDGVREELFVAEVGAGFEIVEEEADAIKVVRGGKLGDGEGEGATV